MSSANEIDIPKCQTLAAITLKNWQRDLSSKWLEKTPRILLLDEPTRGVDVGAKFEIYNVIRQLAAASFNTFLNSSTDLGPISRAIQPLSISPSKTHKEN